MRAIFAIAALFLAACTSSVDRAQAAMAASTIGSIGQAMERIAPHLTFADFERRYRDASGGVTIIDGAEPSQGPRTVSLFVGETELRAAASDGTTCYGVRATRDGDATTVRFAVRELEPCTALAFDTDDYTITSSIEFTLQTVGGSSFTP